MKQRTTQKHEFLRTFLYFHQNLFFDCRLLLFILFPTLGFHSFLFLIFIYIYSFHYYDLAFFTSLHGIGCINFFFFFCSFMNNSITSIHVKMHICQLFEQRSSDHCESESQQQQSKRGRQRETHTNQWKTKKGKRACKPLNWKSFSTRFCSH